MVKEDNERSFYWDGNVAVMSEQRAADGTKERNLPVLHYYLQDELGSPVRVSGYDTTPHPETGINTSYLTYGYDEFGNDLYDDLYNELEETGIPNPYARQGEEQPFGYTGYRHDDISGTYFAQAREYQPENGQFMAEDVIKGNGAVPETLNRYGYCWGNPVMLVDLDGKLPYFPTMTGPMVDPNGLRENPQLPEFVETVEETLQRSWNTIQDSWNALYNKASYVWENYIYGEDTTTIDIEMDVLNDFYGTYEKVEITETNHTGGSIIVRQTTEVDGVEVSDGYTIGIPKVFNIGATLGSDGLSISAFGGLEGVFEAYESITFNSSSIVEFDSKREIGWDGNMVGYGYSFGVSPYSEVKLYGVLESVNENGENVYIERGGYVRTGLVYAYVSIAALAYCGGPIVGGATGGLVSVYTYVMELLGISPALLSACNP